MPGMNIALEIGLDCPGCGASDRCGDDCICPLCWPDSGVEEQHRGDSVRQWLEFAPLLTVLNDEDIYWGWSTERRNGKPKHSLEITSQEDDSTFDVHKHRDGYVITRWRWTRGDRERNIAPEVQELDEILAHTVDEAANFLSPARRRR